MPFFSSYADKAGPGDVFRRHPDIYRHWLLMGEAIMNGPSPLSPGEREMIAAYVSGLNSCNYCYGAHAPVAEEWGIETGLLGKLLEDVDSAPIDAKFKPLLAFLRKLTLQPARMNQADADAVFAAGWDEQALHDAIAVACRFAFMNRLVEGHGFAPQDSETARENAKRRLADGYANYYPDMSSSGDKAAE